MDQLAKMDQVIVNSNSMPMDRSYIPYNPTDRPVVPEGTIHLIVPIKRWLARDRANRYNRENCHGERPSPKDCYVYDTELVISRRPERANLGGQDLAQSYYGFTSLTGVRIPPRIKNQWDFECLWQFLGVALASYITDTNKQNNTEFSNAARAKITTTNTGPYHMLFGNKVAIEFRHWKDGSIRIPARNGQPAQILPSLPEPYYDTKSVAITVPVQYDQIFAPTRRMIQLLKDDEHHDTPFETCAEKFKNFILMCVVQGVSTLIEKGHVVYNSNPTAADDLSENLMSFIEDLGILQNNTTPLATDILKRTLECQTASQLQKPEKDFIHFEKEATDGFIKAQQELYFKMHDRIVGQARTSAPAGGKFDLLV